MSKYDKERESMGIAPLGSSPSKKSKYDDDRKSYKRFDEDKQYSDQMKSAYQANPTSFNLPPIKNQEPTKKTGWNGVLDNPIVRNAVKGYETVRNNANAMADAGTNAMTFGLSNKLYERVGAQDALKNQQSHPAARITGQLTGDMVGIGKLYKGGAALTKAILPNAGKLTKLIIPGLAAGAGYQTAKEAVDMAVPDQLGLSDLMNPNGIPKKETLAHRGLNVAETAALFAGGDVALRYAGKGIKALSDKTGLTSKISETFDRMFNRVKPNETVPVQSGPILGLPEPRSTIMARELERRGTLAPGTKPILAPGETVIPELPAGNYTPPTRLKVNNPAETLDYVMTKIKPDVMAIIEAPARRDLLVQYVQKNTQIPVSEIHNMPIETLKKIGQDVQDGLHSNMKQIAYDVAKQQGHDLPALLESQAPSLRAQIARDKQSQVYGVQPPKMDIQKPAFNVTHEGNVAMPETKIKSNPDVKFAAETPKAKSKSKYAAEREKILKSEAPKVKEQPINATDDHVPHAEPRIRDKVTNYLDEAAQAARERLKAKRNTLSSNPIDQYADYAIIGASHLANGAVKFADFSSKMIADFGDTIKPHLKEIFNRSKEIHKGAEIRTAKDMQGLKDVDPTLLKDFSGLKYNSSDVYRNFKDVFGDKFPQMKEAILDPLDAAKHDNSKMQEVWLNKLYTEVVENLGIEKGSKLSALVQKFGEKQIDLLQLKKIAPKDWEKVIEADKFFRKSYDELIDKVNETRKAIYPNNPDKIVPKRDDYYRHFQDFGGLTGLKNLFDTPAGIDPHLVGMSEFTLPKSKFAGFMQKRGLGPFKNDAVGGFLNYIPSASYATHIDPQIDVFKNLAKNLASETEKTKNINGFIEFLQKYSQDLAGKTNSLDRAFQEYVPGGRKAMAALSWINSRVKSNTILGNAGSALAQVANIPVGIAFAKQYAIKGAGKTLISAIKGNPLHDESQFLKERFIGKEYRKFDTRWLDSQNPLKLKNAAVWMLETADRMGTEFIWNSSYEKAIKEGIKNPIKYADDNARRLIAGRGIGEVPLMQKSKLFQTIAPFTLEVANLWRIQKDFIKEKDFGALALLLVGNYAFNKVAEKIKGSGVTFDPIQAIVEASADGLSPLERAGRLAGEVVSNVPLGSTIASLYPEYGTKKLPTRKKLFGDNDPTRFGSGLIAAKGLQDPLFKLLPGFGGGQIKKTIGAVEDIKNSGAMIGGKEKTPIKFNPLKSAQALTFGTNATKDMQTYFNNDRRPLSLKQTAQLNSLPKGDRQKAYDYLMTQRAIESLKSKAKEIADNEKMSVEKKKKETELLIKKYNSLVK